MKHNTYFLLAGLTLASLPASAATSILTSGHVDLIGIAYEDGEFEPHIHADVNALIDGSLVGDDPANVPDGREFAPTELIVQTSLTTLRAAGSDWNPVGVGSGQSFWTLLETDQPGQPFVGIGAEELDKFDWSTPISITLLTATGSGVDAGGKFSLWQTAAGVPTFYMSTNDGISGLDDVFDMNLNDGDHAHFGWGFTELGIYDLEFEITGTHVTDGVKTATATYSVSVVPEPSSAVLLGVIGVFAASLRHRRNR